MKRILQIVTSVLLLLTLNSQLSTAFAQGTAFTYQGRLNNNGAPANGSYDFSFALINSGSGGLLIAGPVTNSAVAVTNGLFTTTVDFGNVFTGGSNWLQIAVSTNSANVFSTLMPRQQLTPVPYAVYAANVSGISIQQNSDGAPNVILGSSVNFASGGVVGATIGGGGTTNYFGSPYTNSVTADFGTVGGGYQNTASGEGSTVAGGVDNTASGIQAMVGGGYGNTASGDSSTVAGGDYNIASGNYSFAAGRQAQALNQGAFVWADSQNAVFASTNNDSFNVRAAGGAQFVTGGGGMTVDGQSVLTTGSSIPASQLPDGLGGSGNTANAPNATVSGGEDNVASDDDATVAGGYGNTASGSYSAVSGGDYNTASGYGAIVAGGGGSVASGNFSFAAGSNAHAEKDGSFVWADLQGPPFVSTNNNSFNVRATGGARFETGGTGMTVDGQQVLTTGSSLLGLSIQQNSYGAPNVILGSPWNFVSNSVVGATIGGGGITNYYGSGSYTNSVTADFGTVSGGAQNSAGGFVSTVAGGTGNIASGDYATVVGGFDNIASGEYSFAAGQEAQALNDGSFVWADSQDAVFASTNNDSFNVRAQGGARFVTGGAGMSVDGPVTVTGGSVGIGTTTPAAGLDVESSPTGINHGNWGYLQQPGYTPGPLSGSPNLDIYTSGSIGASTYYAFSDERIKNVIGVSSSVKDLNTLMAIHVTDYTYKDTVTHGNGPVKKVIAQQVESVYPQAVFKTVGVIPDIYRQATIKDGWIQLATSLKVGEKVKLIGESGQGIYQVLEVRLGEFRTDFKTDTDQVFVFGRQVDDFRNVDYEALSTLNISATQELAKRLAAESSEVSALKQELAEMKEVMAQLRDNQETQLTDKTTPQTRARASIRQPLITASLEN